MTNEPINQSIDQATNQSINQSIDHMDHPGGYSIYSSIHESESIKIQYDSDKKCKL